jgi:hypothetical protein
VSDDDREADVRPTSLGEAEARSTLLGRQMQVRHQQGGICASSVARGGGCASGVTQGGGGASGVTRGGGCAFGIDGEADACPAVVRKGREVRSKPEGWHSASGRVSSRWLLRAGGRRPLWLGRC